MTPQILLRNLFHCFIKMEMIALLIFDECHHAQVKSDHPYAEIMKVYIVYAQICIQLHTSFHSIAFLFYFTNIDLLHVQVFYKTKSTKRPRIFGMTASLVVGKGEATLHMFKILIFNLF